MISMRIEEIKMTQEIEDFMKMIRGDITTITTRRITIKIKEMKSLDLIEIKSLDLIEMKNQ